MSELPLFPGQPRKNDTLFMYGAVQPRPFVFTYLQQDVEVVRGPSCIPERELFLDNCANDGVPVVERRGGGGTVVLSPGMVITVIVGARGKGESPLDIFRRIHSAMIVTLAAEGVGDLQMKGISDLAIGDRKVAGSSLYLGARPFLYYYQSSLMIDSDLSLLDRYLRHPPREPGYRANRPHGGFCTTLHREKHFIAPLGVAVLFERRLASLIARGEPSGQDGD